MGASVDVATWVSVGCAAVSAVFAGVTVWWPWHTRPAPDLRHEKDEFSVTRERIRQIEAKALRKLRHSSRANILKECMA